MLDESIAFYEMSSNLDESTLNRGANDLQSGKAKIYLGKYDEAIPLMHRAIKTMQLQDILEVI